MSFFSRLFHRKPSAREELRPLWHRIVEISREPDWYRDKGAADTLPGRFDMITAILSLTLLRMETEEELTPASVYLTELFVDDMDGQLREQGVGDVVVGKHVGRLMSVLGGRLGAYRSGLAASEFAEWTSAIERNVTLRDGVSATSMAEGLREFYDQLLATDKTALLAGRIER
ncbi:ubiquinol-cytochrome C chaperone family protein [Altericroceibacterium endophyticum]|uniref:Ubiquinol-cytochrome c chaperone domain-containing protein n=1 Tax=Altericroceibacterium endophyticum TaxID=1808508 RepID=A0A6I4T4Z2_9SPHN|nr:ubiquinol-cytochrome C chaperone family protein [Altericroceibacterium endophyticum]MXO65937.1 hypothetical protein [Altericroceibacterium endophyticum]